MKTSGKARFRVTTPESLGLALRHYRTGRGLSQAALARRAGIHRTYLSALEQGHRTEHVTRLLRLLKHLDVDLILEGDEE